MSYLKTATFVILILLVILLLGGIGGVFFDRYAVPRLAAMPRFASMDIFKKATEHVTVINKTEQIVIREDDTVERIVSQPATAVVNILAIPEVTGSGSVVTTTGVFLTNDGLVATYSETSPLAAGVKYLILLYDGSSHEASLLGYDPMVNLSFFRLKDGTNTPAIALANSDDARVGRRLIAIGNTFGEYQNRLSLGILSNINRVFNIAGKSVSSSEKWEGVFEMSLANPEDFAGGPVIGYNGEMVGLVGISIVDSVSRSFLLPSNVVRDSMNRAIAGKLITRSTLGVYYLPITKAYALGQGLTRDRGALIYSVSGKTGLAIISDSPAARAGLLAGDIITAVNGKEVNLDSPLPELLSPFNRGDKIELLIIRGGEERKVPVQF